MEVEVLGRERLRGMGLSESGEEEGQQIQNKDEFGASINFAKGCEGKAGGIIWMLLVSAK